MDILTQAEFDVSIREEMRAAYAAALARISELQAAQRWIPVSERLPEPYKIVWASVMGRTREAILTKAGKWRVEGDYFEFKSVTHWMPLPPAPGQEEK